MTTTKVPAKRKTLTLAEKNKSFWKLSKDKQKVAIAKDVIKQVKSKFYVALIKWYTHKSITYPRIVHNTCTNTWAVQTGQGWFGIDGSLYHHYWVTDEHTSYWEWAMDNNLSFLTYKKVAEERATNYAYACDLPLGQEKIFTDSMDAVNSYKEYLIRTSKQDSVNRANIKAQELAAERQKQIDDSLFKCNHTYK